MTKNDIKTVDYVLKPHKNDGEFHLNDVKTLKNDIDISENIQER